jgi:hypothetical protein
LLFSNVYYIFADRSQPASQPKDKCSLRENLLIAIVLFTDGQMPSLYLLPSITWHTPNSLFVSHDNEGKKSPPEWGTNLSKKRMMDHQDM